MNKTFEWKWSDLMKWRPEIMGMAMLWIIIFHCRDYTAIAKNSIISSLSLYDFISKGGSGVDIFLFLSGIGVYYSLKNKTILQYYKKKILRIIPTYLCIACVYFLIVDLIFHKGNLLIDILGLSWFVDKNPVYWYIPAQMIFYFIAPFFIFLFYKCPKKVRNISFVIAMILCVAFNTWFSITNYAMYKIYNHMTGRLAIFIIGIFIAEKTEGDNHFSKWWILLSLFGTDSNRILEILSKKLSMGPATFLRLHCGIMGIGVMILFLIIISKIQNQRILSFLQWCGKRTLQLYLLHIAYRNVFMYAFPKLISGSAKTAIGLYALVIACTFITVIIIDKIKEKIKSKKYRMQHSI